jgi:multidrug efflux pump subunit AcrB
MFGLSSATVLTLFIIPMIYYLVGGRDKVTAGETPAP